jgi:asparagine synthase (glutamine-hydrolysing)
MCGLCGIAYADRHRAVTAGQLSAMCDCLDHRGPDDSGLHLAGNVGLGHRRLSIVDLAGGHQPMSNEDDSVWIVFNGEVYNHADFRAALTARGHRYRSRCDTEAILHLYEEHGAVAAADLRGMFAFALWDQRRETLVLARDRLGIKPLFYALTAQGDLVFGSEIKSLYASGLLTSELNAAALPEWFATGHTAGEHTLYRGVRKLAPGHVLIWHDGATTLRPYWQLNDQATRTGSRNGDLRNGDDSQQFWQLFREAVRRMLMADVPLGVFLSGGLDSSLLVAAMRECGVERPRTFSVGFDDAGANELPYARTVAARFATEHHEVMVSPEEFFSALPALSWHRDLPLTFPASIPLFFVAQLAQRHVKVVLTGEGSDELFAGYGRYPRGLHNFRLARALDALLPAALRGRIAAAAHRLDDGYLASRIKRSFIASRGTFEEAYLESFAEFDRQHRRDLLVGGAGDNVYEPVCGLLDHELLRDDPLEAMLRLDQLTYLEELLEKQDQMSMAASIESRVPFLDESLVEWATHLPSGAKLRHGVGKAVVRNAAARYLPESIVRAKKRGFTLPLAEWFRGPGRAWLHEYAPTPRDDLLRADYVERLLREHERGYDHSGRLWRVLAFQVWRREVLPQLHDSAPVAATALR